MQVENLNLRNYAHLGDSVWEVFIRTYTINKTSNSKLLHKLTVERANAVFQKYMLDYIMPNLFKEEQELVRRARNLPIPVGRRHIQADYRLATAFEVLIGYWYLNDTDRLNEIFNVIKANEYFS